MIELWGMGSPVVIKVVLMLEELELPYTVHPLKVFKGEQFAPAFRALNPNAKAPVIVDPAGPDGGPITVFESGAILTYLAEKCDRLLARHGAARYEQLQWMYIQTAGLGPAFGQTVHFTRFAPDQTYSKSRFQTEAVRYLDLLEERLGQAPWLGGADYSVADIATYPWIAQGPFVGLVIGERPRLQAWSDVIAARPAMQRTQAHWDAMRAQSAAAQAEITPEDIDRFTGRGRYARAF